MKTAAHVLTENQHLQISDNKYFSDTLDDSRVNHEDVSTAFIEDGLFKDVAPLYYRTRVRLSFALSEDFHAHFVMMKGLIEFYRSKGFTFQYNFKQRAIEIDIEVSQITELQQFLKKISIWLKEELRFKDALKRVLKFENQYKLERAAVYSSLRNTTV